MAYITILDEGKQYYLMEQPDDTWYFTDELPPFGDEVAFYIEFTTEDGKIATINTDNQFIIDVLSNFVSTGHSYHGYRMYNYYPEVIKVLKEYQALINALGFEIDFLKCRFTCAFNDAFLMTMGEDRIIEWENALAIIPNDLSTLADRRAVIMARLQGGFKLNTESINTISKTLTGNSAESYFENSSIYVTIITSEGDRTLLFPAVEEELKRRIPAHIGLNVTRYYTSWGEIKDNIESWQSLKNRYGTWDDVKWSMFKQ